VREIIRRDDSAEAALFAEGLWAMVAREKATRLLPARLRASIDERSALYRYFDETTLELLAPAVLVSGEALVEAHDAFPLPAPGPASASARYSAEEPPEPAEEPPAWRRASDRSPPLGPVFEGAAAIAKWIAAPCVLQPGDRVRVRPTPRPVDADVGECVRPSASEASHRTTRISVACGSARARPTRAEPEPEPAGTRDARLFVVVDPMIHGADDDRAMLVRTPNLGSPLRRSSEGATGWPGGPTSARAQENVRTFRDLKRSLRPDDEVHRSLASPAAKLREASRPPAPSSSCRAPSLAHPCGDSACLSARRRSRGRISAADLRPSSIRCATCRSRNEPAAPHRAPSRRQVARTPSRRRVARRPPRPTVMCQIALSRWAESEAYLLVAYISTTTLLLCSIQAAC